MAHSAPMSQKGVSTKIRYGKGDNPEVPVKTVQGELVVKEEDEKFPEMVPPFTPVDREADYREAWAHFELVLQEERE